jgi:hypothetical protein
LDNLKDYELEKADFIAETHLDNECDCGFLYPCGAEDCIFGQLVNGEITIKDFAIYIKEICNEDIDL